MITRFFGVEGTAYTALTTLDKEIKLTIQEFLEGVWGERFYKGIPEKQRKIIEEDRIGITIAIHKIDADAEELPVLTAADINDEAEQIVLGKLANAKIKSTSKSIMESITMLIIGAGLMYFIVKQGYI